VIYGSKEAIKSSEMMLLEATRGQASEDSACEFAHTEISVLLAIS